MPLIIREYFLPNRDYRDIKRYGEEGNWLWSSFSLFPCLVGMMPSGNI